MTDEQMKIYRSYVDYYTSTEKMIDQFENMDKDQRKAALRDFAQNIYREDFVGKLNEAQVELDLIDQAIKDWGG